MTAYVLVDEAQGDGLQTFLDYVCFLEDMLLNTIRKKQVPFRSSTIDALSLASDDGHHLRKLFDLGRDLATTLETK